MERVWLVIGLVGFVAAYAGPGISSEASVEKGRQLFNDAGLGGSTNNKSCGSCHVDGVGLKEAGTNEEILAEAALRAAQNLELIAGIKFKEAEREANNLLDTEERRQNEAEAARESGQQRSNQDEIDRASRSQLAETSGRSIG